MEAAIGTVVVVGSINKDLSVALQSSIGPGETGFAERTFSGSGGKGLNQAIAAARWGAEVRMVGAVGRDKAGKAALADLMRFSVDTSHITRAAAPTGQAHIWVSPSGENQIAVLSGANSLLSPAFVETVLSASSAPEQAVLLQQCEVNVDVVERASAIAQARGWRQVLNLSPLREGHIDAIARADPLILNESEAETIFREPVLPAGSSARLVRLIQSTARSVVVTMGGEGALVVEGGVATRIAAPRVRDVVDTTGAGDAFAGTLAAALADDASLLDATRAGIKAGSISVQKAGSISSYSERLERS